MEFDGSSSVSLHAYNNHSIGDVVWPLDVHYAGSDEECSHVCFQYKTMLGDSHLDL